jgi:hypothetical protein
MTRRNPDWLRWGPSARCALIALCLALAACTDPATPAPGKDATTTVDTAATDTDVIASGCTTDAECAAAGQVCDSESHACVACRVTTDCQAGERCVEHGCVPPIPCQSDKPCKATQEVCDLKAGVCVGCVTSSDCTGDQVCLGQACVDPPPPCKSSNDCKNPGQICDKAAGHCVDCLANADCSPAQFCADGVCRADLCKAGSVQCIGADVGTCKSDGSGWDQKACAVGGSACGGDGQCLTNPCIPGTAFCGKSAVFRCAADGKAWVSEGACPAGMACAGGVCLAPGCKPDSLHCGNHALLKCDADGKTWSENGNCSGACVVVNSSTAVSTSCLAFQCPAGKNVCMGDVAVTCDKDAAGTGTDCAAKGQTCEKGACIAKKCVPGSKICSDALTSATCIASGSGYDKVECTDGAICVAGSCKAVTCTPGATFCDGTVLRKCNESGTGGTSVKDCADSGQFCSAGACTAQLCTPGATDCQGGQLATCSVDGKAWTLKDCAANQACDGKACKPLVCKAGGLSCAGNVVVQCNALGTASLEQKDCSVSGLTCVDGVCGNQSCVPGKVACVQGGVGTCKAGGTGWDVQSCADTNLCTIDTCDSAKLACVHDFNTCDDGNACTLDGCSFGDGTCGHSNSSASCDLDGNPCTADQCGGGQCKAGPALACDDNNPCTVDSCTGGQCGHDVKPMDGKACDSAGSVCSGGACGLTCKTGVDCPAGCACGSGQCTGLPKSSTSFTIDTTSTIGAWHPFRKEWWFFQPGSKLICRLDGNGASVGCFDAGIANITQVCGDPSGDYAYVAAGQTVYKWKGAADQVLWNYSSTAAIAGVAADADYVYIAPTWGPTNLERLHKLSGAWLNTIAQGTLSITQGLVVRSGVAYLGQGNGLGMVDITTGKQASKLLIPNSGILLRDNLLCAPSGKKGPGNVPCWDLASACPLP